MNLSLPRRLKAGTCVLAAALTMPAWADTELMLDRHGAGELPVELPVQYRDANNLRIGDETLGSHYLVSGGRRFVLFSPADGDKRFAMDMDEFLAREDAPAAVEPDPEALSVTPTDRQQTVQGVTGQVFEVEAGDRSWELVLTGDERIVAVTEAVYGAEIRMATMSGQAAAAEPLAAELALARSLGAPGILRGQLYTLAALREVGDLPEHQYRLAGDTLVVSDWKEMQDAYH